MNIPSVIALVTGAASGLGRATAQRLLKNGANPMLKDLHGDLPVHVASRNGQRIIVKQFLQHDRAVEMLSRKNGKNKRPLDLAKKLSCVIMLNKKEETTK